MTYANSLEGGHSSRCTRLSTLAHSRTNQSSGSIALPSLVVPQDGTKLASGGADNAGRLFDVTTGQPTQFARHEGPIKGLRWIDGPNIVATGSWDKTLKVIAEQQSKWMVLQMTEHP